MLNISGNNIITLTRGDTFEVPLFINAGTELNPIRYILRNDESLHLGLMEANQLYENKILEKIYDKDDFNENYDVMISFDRCDTINLLEGTYYFEIKLFRTVDDDSTELVNTVISKTKFVLVN